MEQKKQIIRLINDWIESNPAFKKKFSIEDFYTLPNKIVQITTEPTTKTNQVTLQKLLPNFLKYASIDSEKVYVTNLLNNNDLNFVDYIKKYLLNSGLRETEFKIYVSNPSPFFVQIDVIANIGLVKLATLKNFQTNENGLFSFDLIDKKYKGLFSYNLEFTEKLFDSITKLNNEMIDYLSRTKYWDSLKSMNPKIGLFKGSTHVEIFIDDNGKEHLLRNILDGFFKFLGFTKNDWSTYRRGPWIDENEIVYG